MPIGIRATGDDDAFHQAITDLVAEPIQMPHVSVADGAAQLTPIY